MQNVRFGRFAVSLLGFNLVWLLVIGCSTAFLSVGYKADLRAQKQCRLENDFYQAIGQGKLLGNMQLDPLIADVRDILTNSETDKCGLIDLPMYTNNAYRGLNPQLERLVFKGYERGVSYDDQTGDTLDVQFISDIKTYQKFGLKAVLRSKVYLPTPSASDTEELASINRRVDVYNRFWLDLDSGRQMPKNAYGKFVSDIHNYFLAPENRDKTSLRPVIQSKPGISYPGVDEMSGQVFYDKWSGELKPKFLKKAQAAIAGKYTPIEYDKSYIPIVKWAQKHILPHDHASAIGWYLIVTFCLYLLYMLLAKADPDAEAIRRASIFPLRSDWGWKLILLVVLPHILLLKLAQDWFDSPTTQPA